MSHGRCTCESGHLHRISDDLAVKTADYGEQAFVVHLPGRLGGRATIGHRRISTEMVADMYWQGGFDDLIDGYDLTHGEVVVAVWYEAQHGTRRQRKRWKEWYEVNA